LNSALILPQILQQVSPKQLLVHSVKHQRYCVFAETSDNHCWSSNISVFKFLPQFNGSIPSKSCCSLYS